MLKEQNVLTKAIEEERMKLKAMRDG